MINVFQTVATVTTSDWLIASGILAGSIAVVLVLRQLIKVLTRSLRFQGYVTTIVTRFVATIVILVGLVYALRQLEVELGPVLGALGLGGLVVALSLQHVLGNLVGSVLLHARRPIRRGDQIHSNGHSGTVIDISGRAVVILTFDGEQVFIPNLKVLDEPLLNQTADAFRRTVIPFQVGYEADLRLVVRVIARGARHLPGLEDAPPSDVIVTSLDDSGISLNLRMWHPSEEITARWVISEAIMMIRETLAEHDVTIPFPQRVLHMAPVVQPLPGLETGHESS